MRIFYTVLICIVVALIAITVHIRHEATKFFGIAEARERVINSEFGVEIKTLYITPGQAVTAGDTLMELRSPEIDLKINEYTHLVDVMKSRTKSQANLSKSEIRKVRNEYASRINEIRTEMEQLQAQYSINQKMTEQLKSIRKNSGNQDNGYNNPTLIKIQNLKAELARLRESSALLQSNSNSHISFGVNPLQEQLEQYFDLLRLYQQQKKKLVIVAPIDGVVGEVNYKNGALVSAFDSIATIHSRSPSFVQGYIHENSYSSVKIGRKVSVSSVVDKDNMVTGEVIGVGTRIVEYPIRLRKISDLQMYGREVTIRIPRHNRFLLGEKVLISINKSPEKAVKEALGLSPDVQAQKATDRSQPGIQKLSISPKGAKETHIEASGVLYIEDEGMCCIISDEHSMLYLMDTSGTFIGEAQVEGLKNIDDMESIASDENGTIYIMCSQNPKKNGTLPENRRLLIRLRRKGKAFRLDGKIKFIDALAQAVASADSMPSWGTLTTIDGASRVPDIEGLACRQDNLYIGFKDPLLDGKAAILRIRGLNSMFQNNSIDIADVKLWKAVSLQDRVSGITYRLSGLNLEDDMLYITSTGEHKKKGKKITVGRVWQVGIEGEQPKKINDYIGLKPEGVTSIGNKKLLVTFDNGSSQASQFTVLKAM
ncbi:MAG: DUF3616 domain-containing protein [Fibrobacterota bacterium]